MRDTNNTVQRALWAKKIVEDSAGSSDRDPRDVLTAWDREFMLGYNSVQLRIPLRDPVELRRHLELVEAAVRELRYTLGLRIQSDRVDLMTAQGVFRSLTKKLNAMRYTKRK